MNYFVTTRDVFDIGLALQELNDAAKNDDKRKVLRDMFDDERKTSRSKEQAAAKVLSSVSGMTFNYHHIHYFADSVSKKLDDSPEKREKWTDQLKSKILKNQNFICPDCGCVLTFETCQFDHLFPFESMGDSMREMNLRCVCEKCNRQKGVKLYLRTAAELANRINKAAAEECYDKEVVSANDVQIYVQQSFFNDNDSPQLVQL